MEERGSWANNARLLQDYYGDALTMEPMHPNSIRSCNYLEYYYYEFSQELLQFLHVKLTHSLSKGIAQYPMHNIIVIEISKSAL